MRRRGNGLVSAAALVLLGLLFIIFKSDIISIAMSLIAALLIVVGIFNIIRKNVVGGVIKIVIGGLILAAGWLIVELALYIFAAVLLIAGVIDLYRLSKIRDNESRLSTIMHFIQPIIYILVAICLLFNQGGTLSWVFTVSGIFFIIDGVVALIGSFDK